MFYFCICSISFRIWDIVQTKLRDMQDSWLSKKADEIQSFADRKDMKKIFDALNTVYGAHPTP